MLMQDKFEDKTCNTLNGGLSGGQTELTKSSIDEHVFFLVPVKQGTETDRVLSYKRTVRKANFSREQHL